LSGLTQDFGKKAMSDFTTQKPFPTLGEGRVILDLVIHRETDKPAEQEVIVHLFNQLTLTTDSV
jgi:hypothetical protein